MNKKYKKAVVIVLDSVGCGALPDSEKYGDCGSNTLLHTVFGKEDLLPNLRKSGLFNICGLEELKGLPKNEQSLMMYGRLQELSEGKDTTTGHFELAGVITEKAYPVFKNGLPKEILDKFTDTTGFELLGDGKPASGTEIIKEFGNEHIKTNKPIVYTSADSVFQIACCEETFGLDNLYSICEKARSVLTGDFNIARVIARPFNKKGDEFIRTENRRDYSVLPPSETMLTKLSAKGFDVMGVGKIGDIFSGQGITKSYHTGSNKEGMEKTIELINSDYNGLVFTNLVDFDMLYGHRRNKEGYLNALMEFDNCLPLLMQKNDDTILIITADHGCDPTHHGTDHTREYVPFLMSPLFDSSCSHNLGTVKGLGFVADTVQNSLVRYSHC